MMMLTHGHRSPHAVVTPYDEMSQSVAHSFAPERAEYIHPLRQTAHVGSIAFVLPRGYDVALQRLNGDKRCVEYVALLWQAEPLSVAFE